MGRSTGRITIACKYSGIVGVMWKFSSGDGKQNAILPVCENSRRNCASADLQNAF